MTRWCVVAERDIDACTRVRTHVLLYYRAKYLRSRSLPSLYIFTLELLSSEVSSVSWLSHKEIPMARADVALSYRIIYRSLPSFPAALAPYIILSRKFESSFALGHNKFAPVFYALVVSLAKFSPRRRDLPTVTKSLGCSWLDAHVNVQLIDTPAGQFLGNELRRVAYSKLEVPLS